MSHKKIDHYNVGCGVVIFLIAISLIISWVITSFVYWLITLCFDWEWTVLHATGIWLIMLLLGGVSVKIKS